MGRVPRYIASGVVASIVILAAILLLKPTGLGGSLAFADVQEAMRRIDTAVVDIKCPKRPSGNHRLYLARGHNGERKDFDGGVFLLDCDQGKVMVLDHKNKTARFETIPSLKGYEHSTALDKYFDFLSNVDQHAVKHLGLQEIEGRKLIGFHVERPGNNINCFVWIDPKTRLPVCAEERPVDPNDKNAALIETNYVFSFNKPLDDSLFKLAVPEGYRIVEE